MNKNNLNNMEEKIKYFLIEMGKIPVSISNEKDKELSSDYYKGYKDAIVNIRNLFLKIFVFPNEELTLKMIEEGKINIEFWLVDKDILRIFNENIADKDKGELIYKNENFFIRTKFEGSEVEVPVPLNEEGAKLINSIIDIDSPAVVRFHRGTFWLGFKNGRRN